MTTRKLSRRDVLKGSSALAIGTVFASPVRAQAPEPVAIRQHDIQLSTQAPASQQNAIKAVVTRQVYLGVARDYMVEVADGTTLRVTTPNETNVSKGSEVWLTLPPDRCRALRR